MPRETYSIVITRPADCSVRRMKEYIKEAIDTWNGSFRPPGSYGDDDPGDPLFNVEFHAIIRRKSRLPENDDD